MKAVVKLDLRLCSSNKDEACSSVAFETSLGNAIPIRFFTKVTLLFGIVGSWEETSF